MLEQKTALSKITIFQNHHVTINVVAKDIEEANYIRTAFARLPIVLLLSKGNFATVENMLDSRNLEELRAQGVL